MGDMSVEPSMEEILSSIKRIIAEEGDGPTRGRRLSRAVPPARDDADDSAEVLELSDPIPGPAPVSRPEPVFERPDPVLRIEPRIEAARTVPPRIEPASPPAPPPPEPAARAPAPEPEPIISPSTAEASRGSLESLSRVLVKPDPASDGTLEGLVRDMLRPMLREWLDRNLPAMVETLVADEIARITGQPR